MVENQFYQISKKTKKKLSMYINIIVFFIIALFIYLLIIDAYTAGTIAVEGSGDSLSQAWLNVARDIVFVAIGFTWIFFQFFKNQLLTVNKSW